MNRAVYDKISMVDVKLAFRYECLPQPLYEALDPGLIDSITACEAIGLMPSIEAIREMIDDALKGNFYFKDNLVDRSKRR